MRLPFSLARFRRDASGVALTEFAFAAPLVLAMGMYGTEMAKLGIARMQLSQVTMNLADTLSRVGLDSGLSVVQLTEANVNDSIVGAQLAAAGLNLTTNGRLIVSGLQLNASGGQWIAWQRCKGLKVVGSSYGVQDTGKTGTSFAGMGPSTARVTAAAAAPVVYVELKYDYQPLYPFLWSSTPDGKVLGSIFNTSQKAIVYGNANMVRDNREQGVVDTAGTITTPAIRNPNNPLTGTPATPSLCTTYSA